MKLFTSLVRWTQPSPPPEAVSMNRRRFAVVLVPVPEGSDVDVLPFQGVNPG
jgi:hypothetical protein